MHSRLNREHLTAIFSSIVQHMCLDQWDESLEIRLGSPACGTMLGARMLQQVVRRPQHPAEEGQPFSAIGRDAADRQNHHLRRRFWSSQRTLANISADFVRCAPSF
jgi:hypothetical protein